MGMVLILFSEFPTVELPGKFGQFKQILKMMDGKWHFSKNSKEKMSLWENKLRKKHNEFKVTISFLNLTN